MERYLYEVVIVRGKHEDIELGTGMPYMPKVLAEKTARNMNRDGGRHFGRVIARKAKKWTVINEYGEARRMGITTKDGTPRGTKHWISRMYQYRLL